LVPLVVLRGRLDSCAGEDGSSSKRRFVREVVGVTHSSGCLVQARFQMSHITLENRRLRKEARLKDKGNRFQSNRPIGLNKRLYRWDPTKSRGCCIYLIIPLPKGMADVQAIREKLSVVPDFPKPASRPFADSKHLFTRTETTLGCIFSRSQSSPPQSSLVRDPYHPSCAPPDFDDNTKLARKEGRCSRGSGSPGLPTRSCYCPSPWGSIRPCSQEGKTSRRDSFS